jgi:hypothetical protein
LARNLASDEATVAARVVEIAALPRLRRWRRVPDRVSHFADDPRGGALLRSPRHDGRPYCDRVKLRLDINFGDPITPAPQFVELPALRPGVAAVRVLGYPIETVLAEMIATAIELGPASTRVRDYADLYTLTGSHDIAYDNARAALLATARLRGTDLRLLSDAVGNIVELRAGNYSTYRTSLGQYGDHLPDGLSEVIAAVTAFADPLVADVTDLRSWAAQARQWIAHR